VALFAIVNEQLKSATHRFYAINGGQRPTRHLLDTGRIGGSAQLAAEQEGLALSSPECRALVRAVSLKSRLADGKQRLKLTGAGILVFELQRSCRRRCSLALRSPSIQQANVETA
jgi:hypothetical protein